ncbi:GNAT family N-acetyltransferase [Solilutibacter silvestris]|uniref:GNAT family N-acetyltransferase n=1 Tax=Solilutibacter silvestris TaxID=1645665 RepID=UPI003D337333
MLTLKADWNYAISGNRRHYLVKAMHRNRVIGRAHGWFSPNSLFVLQKIELDQRHRSRGYGTSIIQELREEARNQSCSSFIFSDVQRSNIRAIRLYESLKATPTDGSAEACAFVLTPP